MNNSSSDLAGLLARCQTDVTALLQATATRSERAARLADWLLERAPRAGLTVCFLPDAGRNELAIRPNEKSLDAEQKKVLRSQLSSLPSVAPGVQMLPVARLNLRLLAARIGEADRSRGFLAIGLPASATAKETARVETLLTVTAPMTALLWDVEAARADRVEMARFALVGQAFLGLAHELNNALNSMMLQTSVVQLRVDEPIRNELAVVRQHGAQAADLVRSLQHVVQERREQSYPVDLNDVVAAVLEENAELRRRVTVRFSEPAPSIHGTRGAVKQLVQLLVDGALAGTESAIRMWTEKHGDGAALSMEITESSTTAGEQPEALLWQNLDEVGRQAGPSLLRQLGGVLEVESQAEGGMVVRVTWEARAPS